MKFIRKVRSDGTELIIKEIEYDVAKDICLKNHYSKKWNTSFGKVNYGIFQEGKLLGVAVYGNLMNPKSAKNITPSGRVLELNRLWVDDVLGHNTETIFLGATFKLLRAHDKCDVVQSFADGRLGVGTIYKASNFKYFGYTESTFYEIKATGEVQHKVPMENTKRPRLFLKGILHLARDEMKWFSVKTYRYVYPIKRKATILLDEKPYPDYEKGTSETDKIIGKGTAVRALILLEALGMYPESLEVGDYCVRRWGDYSDEKEKQLQNKSVKWFIEDYAKKEELIKFLRGD